MEREGKSHSYQDQIQQLRDLHQEDAYAGGESPPFHYPESRNMHHREPAQWAGNLQNEFGQHRRGPTRHR